RIGIRMLWLGPRDGLAITFQLFDKPASKRDKRQLEFLSVIPTQDRKVHQIIASDGEWPESFAKLGTRLSKNRRVDIVRKGKDSPSLALSWAAARQFFALWRNLPSDFTMQDIFGMFTQTVLVGESHGDEIIDASVTLKLLDSKEALDLRRYSARTF